MLTLAQVYTGLTGHSPPISTTSESLPITPWVINSQLVQKGGGFVARPGATPNSADGHTYILDALQRGAEVVLAERLRTNIEELRSYGAQIIDLASPQIDNLKTPVLFLTNDSLATLQTLATWWRQQCSPNLKVIGITGSVGKTTVKELTSVVLSQRFRTWKSKGNYNSDVGLPLTFLDMPLDTERAVVEMGMTRSGEIAELAEIVRPDVGVVTNVGTAHMAYLGTIEAIADAKAELVKSLAPEGVAILNGDDPRVLAMASQSKTQVQTYGLQPKFSLWADQIQSHGLHGIAFRFHAGSQTIFARLPLLGRHSVHAALAAASVGLSQGQSWAEIIAGLRDLEKMEILRIVVVEGIRGSTIIDDSYNASPDSVMAALNLLADLEGRRIAVLGDMLELGDVAERGHKLVARRAANVASLFIAVGEFAPLMAAEAHIAGLPKNAIFATSSRDDAFAWLESRIQSNDVLLIKGSRALRLDKLTTQLSINETTITQQF